MQGHPINPELQQAIQMAQAGKHLDATYTLRSLLRRDPHLLEGWRWLAYVSPDRDEARRALEYVLRMRPHDTWAQQLLAQLNNRPVPTPVQITSRQGIPAQRPHRNRGILPLWLTVIGLMGLALVIVGGTGVRYLRAIGSSPEGVFPIIEQPPTGQTTPIPQVQPASAVIVNENEEFYAFQASNQRDIQQHLYNDGPQIIGGEHSIAVTSYEFQVTWEWQQQETVCQVQDVVVTLNLIYTYPRWEPSGSPPPGLHEEWDRFMRHVIDHEKTHGQIALGCANEISALIDDMEPLASCGTLESRLNNLIDQVYQTCADRQEAYDAAEGRTSFPLP